MRICTHQRLICGILGAKPRLNITQWRFSHTYNLTQLTLTKDPAAISKAKQLEPLIHDDQNDVLINLFRDTPREKIGVMTLGEALRDYIQPGVALVPHRRFQQPINSTRKPPAYTLKNLDITILESQDMANARKTHRKPTKSSRRFLFGLWSSQNLDHFMRSMNLAWHTLMSGSLVEYQLICKQNQSNQAAFKDMIAKYLHLRPDVILKAMPTKSSIVIQPQTDLKICYWIMTET